MERINFNRDWILNPIDGYEIFLNPQSAREQHQVTLPYDAMQLERRDKNVKMGRNTGFYPDGQSAYVKKFTAPLKWKDKTISFEFEGVYTHSMVYINGSYAGGCPHGYTCFTVLADPFLKYGEENELKVMAKTNQDSRWYTGMGIYRGVNLLAGGLCHISAYGHKITTLDMDGTGANLMIETQVENLRHTNVSVQIVTTVSDASGNEIVKNSAPLTLYGADTDTLTQRIYIPNVQLWDTEQPYLYMVESKLLENGETIDKCSCPYGVRTLTLDVMHGIRMNGKELKLRGACVHHDNGILGSAAVGRAEERRVQLLKEAGFNAVRSAHNPMSTAFLDACDKYGLVVMDELTDMWTQRKGDWDYSTDFPTHWPKLVESIVEKDYNHPSVILYSIGNEIHETGTGHGAKIGRRLAKKLKELDPTRFTTNSVNFLMAGRGQVGPEQIMGDFAEAGNPVMDSMAALGQGENNAEAIKSLDINAIMANLGPMMAVLLDSEAIGNITEETFACVDVAGYNYAASRYEKDRERYPSRIIVGSETFPKDIAKNWELVKRFPHVIGDFAWTGWDYLGEAGIGATNYESEKEQNEYPWYIAWCGDFDITGHRRPASYYREIVFGLRKDPYIAVKYPETKGKASKSGGWDFVDGTASWTWPKQEGNALELEIYAPGERAELLLNGEKKAECFMEEYKACAVLTYEPGELIVVNYDGDTEIGRFAICTANDAVSLKARADREVIQADTSDLCYVDITLEDEDGNVNTAADRTVTAVVEGAGYLAGLGSAMPASEESFLTGSFRSFEGRLLAIIRPTQTGEITLKLSADGSEDTEVKIQCR